MEVKSQQQSRNDCVLNIDSICLLIAEIQKNDGEIPWCKGQKTDPWDHIEAAMGLSIGGYYREARRAFKWLAGKQLEDGSWYASYLQGNPLDRTRDANMSAYVAAGVYHYYLITGDAATVRQMWPTVSAAIDFAVRLQTADGEIYWAISPEGKIDPMALLTGCSSIYMSLKCAIAMARMLGCENKNWIRAAQHLANAIRFKPHLFNMTKSRFSMDWFYPILAGVVTGSEAQARIDRYWRKFVVEEKGVRCVSDEPWVTIAETSELTLALSAMGNLEMARIVFNWINDSRYEDGSYWCGFTCPDMVVWPEEKITWTNAAVLLAADAVYQLTPARNFFSHEFWNKFDFTAS